MTGDPTAWRCIKCGDIRSERGELRDDGLCQNIIYSELHGFEDCEGETEAVYVATADEARAIFSRWARIRATERFAPHFACDPANPEAFWNQIAADIEHSGLLWRLLRGEEPR